MHEISQSYAMATLWQVGQFACVYITIM